MYHVTSAIYIITYFVCKVSEIFFLTVYIPLLDNVVCLKGNIANYIQLLLIQFPYGRESAERERLYFTKHSYFLVTSFTAQRCVRQHIQKSQDQINTT